MISIFIECESSMDAILAYNSEILWSDHLTKMTLGFTVYFIQYDSPKFSEIPVNPKSEPIAFRIP